MALHNFEEQAGKKLRERQIAPSAGSWEKLEAKLGRDNDKKKFKIWWPAVAALVVVAFLAGNLLFRTTENSPEIVEEPIKKEIENSSEMENFKSPVEVVSKEEKTPVIQEKEKSVAQSVPQRSIEKENREEVVAILEEEKILQFEIENISLQPPVQEAIASKTNLEEAIARVVSENAEKDLTDTEVDNLLQEAASQIARQQIFNDNRVNASALLADVEAELDQSFREKIFHMLKDSYVEARYAFVNRNN